MKTLIVEEQRKKYMNRRAYLLELEKVFLIVANEHFPTFAFWLDTSYDGMGGYFYCVRVASLQVVLGDLLLLPLISR